MPGVGIGRAKGAGTAAKKVGAAPKAKVAKRARPAGADGSALGVVDLRSIKSRDQFKAYYKQRGLDTATKRIKHLVEVTGVKAIRGTGVGKQSETLASLEEFTILGHWRFLNGK